MLDEYLYKGQKSEYCRLDAIMTKHVNILPHASGEFHPDAHPELKTAPDPSKISSRRNFRKPHVSIRKSYIRKLYQDFH